MMPNLSVDSASHLLSWSNGIYVIGAVLTLGSAAMVLYEKHSSRKGIALRWGLTTEIVVIVAAFVSLAGTIGAIYFGTTVGHLKDVELATFKTNTQKQITDEQKATGDANKAAGDANVKAEQARLKADQIEAKNAQLQKDLLHEGTSARTAEASLGEQNRKTADFTQALQVQQQNMEQQAHVAPVLSEIQIQRLTMQLSPFAGQDVTINRTSETVVGRLSYQIQRALIGAHLSVGGTPTGGDTTIMGALFQGVSVAVHANEGHPALADALSNGLQACGIVVNRVAAPQQVPVGKVVIFLGPS